jgi:glutamate-1-semialdehyde 2,1-aminomutase
VDGHGVAPDIHLFRGKDRIGHTGETPPCAECAVEFFESERAQDRLHAVVPGGAHTYARGPDQFPEGMAPVLVRGRGARVEDVDGNTFVEYGIGLRSVTLGHAHPAVNDAVSRAMADGVNFSRPHVLELEAAETLVAQIPGADMVKFAKNGSDAVNGAVKLARAATGRPLVARSTNQPFFSTGDWFISTTPMRAGTLPTESSGTVGFTFNDLASVQDLFDEHPGQVACLVLEPASAGAEPRPGFLEGVRRLADEHGAVLVFDEMITGMRWSLHGAQHVYGVVPDLSTWGKALGNGFAVSALAGRRELMELGGLRTDESRVFLMSTTQGAEAVGLAAYLAVEREYRSWDVVATMEDRGRVLGAGVEQLVAEAGLADFVCLHGRPSCLVFETRDAHGEPSQAYRTLFLQELLERGVLALSLVVTAAHTDDDIAQTLEAVRGALEVYARAIEAGSTDGLLRGRPVAPALREHAEPRRIVDRVTA